MWSVAEKAPRKLKMFCDFIILHDVYSVIQGLEHTAAWLFIYYILQSKYKCKFVDCVLEMVRKPVFECAQDDAKIFVWWHGTISSFSWSLWGPQGRPVLPTVSSSQNKVIIIIIIIISYGFCTAMQIHLELCEQLQICYYVLGTEPCCFGGALKYHFPSFIELLSLLERILLKQKYLMNVSEASSQSNQMIPFSELENSFVYIFIGS